MLALQYITQAKIDQEGRQDNHCVADEIRCANKYQMLTTQEQEMKIIMMFRLVLLCCIHCLLLYPEKMEGLGMKCQLDSRTYFELDD